MPDFKYEKVIVLAAFIFLIIVIANAVLTDKALFTRRPLESRECPQVWCK